MEKIISKKYILILSLALLSRMLVFALGFISDVLLPSFDKSTHLSQNNSIFKFLLRWDAIHFLHIADHGYTYEHSIPFFPLLPTIVRVLPFSNNMTGAVVFNSTAFIISAALLYKISIRVLPPKTAFLATTYFIFNPAMVIYSSFYSESLFCLLFLLGLHYLISGRMARASSFFALCSLTRSNTLLFLIFFKTVFFPTIIAPFALYQFYNLLLIMRAKTHFKLMVPYSYIQDIYWDQGFLRFIRPWNIGNMLFGIFGISMAAAIVWKYWSKKLHEFSKEQGVNGAETFVARPTINYTASIALSGCSLFRENPKNFIRNFIWDPFCIESTSFMTKLAIILTAQVVVLVFFIHWNIAFRFLSFNPLIYWGLATLTAEHYKNTHFQSCIAVLFAYGIVYIILFSTFYPPA